MVESVKERELVRLSVRWPLTIKTEGGDAQGETRNITGEGMFLYCSERLLEGAVYLVTIKTAEKRIEATGKVTWSNLDYCSSPISDSAMSFYFMRIDQDQDRRSLGEAIVTHFEKPPELRRQPERYRDSLLASEVLAIGRY
jgi:hypothetical protein